MTGNRGRQILTLFWPLAETERGHWVSQAAHPNAPPTAYRAFLCFGSYAEDSQEYARAALSVPDACRKRMLNLLRTVRQLAARDTVENVTILDAIMNVEAVTGAAAYYRTMVGVAESWNLRDRHIADTLDRLL